MNISSFQSVIEDKSKEMINRRILVDVLKQQHQHLPFNEKVNENIQLLLNDNTYTVTTAHQLNILTGPLYIIYKIISTINLAKHINEKYSTIKVVPIFWMATEDHDFIEINHINLCEKKIVWNVETDKEGPVGRMNTSNSIQNTIEEIKSVIGNSENGLRLISTIEDAYLKSTSLAEATRYLLHHLFHDQGLILLDADNHDLKQNFSKIILQDILTRQSIYYVNKSNQQMKGHYRTQAKSSEINFFYLLDNYRVRIVTDGDKFKTFDNKYTFTKEQLKEEIELYPERFSPNVIMRPLYQELLLPNLAYVGGPGELAYWLQLRLLFDFYNVNFPMLVLRNCLLIINEKNFEFIDKSNISISNLFLPIDELIRKFVIQNSNGQINLKEEADLMEQSFKQILDKTVRIDSTLEDQIQTEKYKILATLKTLERKLLKSQTKIFETEIEQLKKIKEELFPSGDLQERYENFIKHYLYKGNHFIFDLINIMTPLSKTFTIISYKRH
ncbi:unnamed protein product [Adineta ricciae]|uniref:Cysteine ligase BshC n=1 Tax=Adineta ricciae TaxID=249248 RepID=A0A815JT85_ADIRI|nr:unnamed protein product [Adineta ricciae]CAF1455730.1 unnamed protein product [Adineta ricciae]